MVFKQKRDIKKYIVNTYGLSEDQFDVIKSGARIWLYVISKDYKLIRSVIFTGSLSTVNVSAPLKMFFLQRIEDCLKKAKLIEDNSNNKNKKENE